MDEWIKDAAYSALAAISNRDWRFLHESNVASRLTQKQIENELALYPATLAPPPLSSKDKFIGDEFFDKTGWWIVCPFYNKDGDITDLELQMSVFGKFDEYRIEITDILVP